MDYIAVDGYGFAAASSYLAYHHIQRLATPTEHGHFPALTCEGRGNRPADPGPAPGNDRYFALQPCHDIT
jgi:hypothetical protein